MYVEYNHNDLANDEESLRKTLTEAVGFDEDDLKTNKAGKLSTPQMVRLSFQVFKSVKGLVASAAGLVTLGIALYVAGPTIMENSRLVLAVGKYLVLGVGAAFFGLLALIVKMLFASGRLLHFMFDMMEGNVTSVAGRMNTSKSSDVEDGLSTFTKHRTETLSCVIKGEYFEINEETYEVLHDRSGSIYRAYVTPRSRYLVAIETGVAEPGARDPFKLEYKPVT